MKKQKTTVADLREDYRLHTLDIKDVLENPIDQFEKWFEEAHESQIPEPNAMTLATCSPDGKPSARVILLKGYDASGFHFYTNYNSRKGKEMALMPYAALVFCWLGLERQVRIEGMVRKMKPEESLAYFQSRPRGSQIGAWTSPQSKVIENREALETLQTNIEKEYEDQEILPIPPYWGGYRVIPTIIEFWQGRSSRLHDRIRYTLQSDKSWKIERLAP